jgi:hypothetical protein
MRSRRREFALTTALAAAAFISQAGCQSGGQRRLASEPGLIAPAGGGSSVVEAPISPVRPVSWVDRHPLFYKPRDVYANTDQNPIVKTAAATVIGIPSGIVGEIRQIVVGTPAPVRY